MERSWGVFLHGTHESWQQDGLQWTDNTSLPATGKQALKKNPFHNTEPTINTDLCRILFHCFQNSCSRGVRAKHIWAYLHVTHIRQNITHAAEAYLNVSWLFYAWITVKPAHWLRGPLHKMSGSESWQTFSTPHFDALHLTAFPSAVPLIFHIRHLIITASRTICFWTNLPRFSNQYQQAGQMAFKLSLSFSP